MGNCFASELSSISVSVIDCNYNSTSTQSRLARIDSSMGTPPSLKKQLVYDAPTVCERWKSRKFIPLFIEKDLETWIVRPRRRWCVIKQVWLQAFLQLTYTAGQNSSHSNTSPSHQLVEDLCRPELLLGRLIQPRCKVLISTRRMDW